MTKLAAALMNSTAHLSPVQSQSNKLKTSAKPAGLAAPSTGSVSQAPRRHKSDAASAGHGGGEDGGEADVDDDGDQPDELVPDPIVRREFNISAMTLWRWDHDAELAFPPPILIRRRKFRSRRQIEKFKQRLVRTAVALRAEATT